MEDLFDVADLADLLGAAPPADQAALARDLAQGLVRDYLRQEVTQATWEVSLPVDSDRYGLVVRLPQRPVTDVTSVRIDGVALAQGSEWTWDGVSPLVRLAWTPGSPSSVPAPLRATVSYDSGWETVPEHVRAVALGVAARIVDNPTGLRSESVDDYSFTRAGSDADLTGLTLTPAERAALRRSASAPLAGSLAVR